MMKQKRRHQHSLRYFATCSLAFRFSDEILFISEMIGHIDPVLSVHGASEYKIVSTPDVLPSFLLTLTSLGTG
jgi:hypothetical protein